MRFLFTFLFSFLLVQAFSQNLKRVQNEYYHAVSAGEIPHAFSEVKFGYNPDIDNGVEEDIWSAGGSITYEAVADEAEVLSSDNSDTTGGTGARVITIYGLDDTYAEVSEQVNMSGTTVVTTTQKFYRVHRVIVDSAGSNGTNAGNITIRAQASDNTQAYIPADYGQTQQAIWTVPKNRKAYIVATLFSCRKTTGGAEPRIQFLINVREPGKAWRRVYREDIDVSAMTTVSSPHLLHSGYPEGTDIRVSAISDVNNSVVTGRIYIVSYDD